MENRREYARVDVRVPFKAMTDNNGTAPQKVFDFLETPSRPSCSYPDALMADWITYLDTKVDAISGLLMTLVDQEESMPLRDISISAGGVGFESEKKFEKGDTLEMRVRFDGHRTFFLYGKVIWSRNVGENRYRVGTTFLNMSSRIVNEINYFVFNQQREILSRKRYNCNAPCS